MFPDQDPGYVLVADDTSALPTQHSADQRVGSGRPQVQATPAVRRPASGRVSALLIGGQWAENAACRTLDAKRALGVFFPDPPIYSPARYDEARAVCGRCSVRSECLDFALAQSNYHDQHGMWGGLTPDERRALRRARSAGARAAAVAS